jgi:hypothetical protein
MRRPFLLASAVCLLTAAAATADLPLPPDLKQVTPRVRFEGVDKLADYAFVLKYNSGNGNPLAAPPKYIDVKNAEPFEMPGGRRIALVQLFAVPRAEAAKLRENDPTMAWLSDKTPGVLKADVQAPSTVAPAKATEVPVTTYRVSMAGDKLKVEMVKTEEKRGQGPTGRVGVAVAAGAAALALALLGLWFVRRRGPAV